MCYGHKENISLLSVLVSIGTEAIFFIVSGMMLCLGFGRKNSVNNILIFWLLQCSDDDFHGVRTYSK